MRGEYALPVDMLLTYAGAFNPEKSYIVINPPDEIQFTDECREGCSLCTRHCEFGAITRIKGG